MDFCEALWNKYILTLAPIKYFLWFSILVCCIWELSQFALFRYFWCSIYSNTNWAYIYALIIFKSDLGKNFHYHLVSNFTKQDLILIRLKKSRPAHVRMRRHLNSRKIGPKSHFLNSQFPLCTSDFFKNY